MRSSRIKARNPPREAAGLAHAQPELSPSCDPAAVLRAWYERAKSETDPTQATAMTLGTCTPQGRPSSRIVTCKAIVDEPISLLFYTKYATRKAKELSENPFASALFYWPNRGRQARIEGRVKRLDDAENRAYANTLSFHERHGLSLIRLGRGITELCRSPQAATDPEPKDATPSQSVGWGGYLLIADAIELWVSRGGRSHTSGRWIRDDTAGWKQEHFSP